MKYNLPIIELTHFNVFVELLSCATITISNYKHCDHIIVLKLMAYLGKKNMQNSPVNL